MRRRHPHRPAQLALGLAATLTLACPSGGGPAGGGTPPPPTATAQAAAAAKHFGAVFAMQKNEPLAAACGRIQAEGATETVQVSGVIDSVCQKMGCWMVLRDGETKARVLMRNHEFFLPKDVAGRRAVVEGELKVRELSENLAKHYEEDRGGDPSKVTGTAREHTLVAAGVAID
jgi:hypothetical protein